jgi:hypothetical protein
MSRSEILDLEDGYYWDSLVDENGGGLAFWLLAPTTPPAYFLGFFIFRTARSFGLRQSLAISHPWYPKAGLPFSARTHIFVLNRIDRHLICGSLDSTLGLSGRTWSKRQV